MAAKILIAGYVLDVDFARFRKNLAAKLVSPGVPFITWSVEMDRYRLYQDTPLTMVQHGRIDHGEKVETLLIMRGVAVGDAFSLSGRETAQAVFIMTANKKMLEEHGGRAGSGGYVLLRNANLPFGDFLMAAIIMRNDFSADALANELFPPKETAVTPPEAAFMETSPLAAIGTIQNYG